MSNYYLLALILFLGLKSMAQDVHDVYQGKNDLKTISGLVSAAYESISGEKGTSRQLASVKSLYTSKGIISKNSTVNGISSREVLSLDEFHDRFSEIREYSFYEEEIKREVRIFGTIASVWSSYQIRNEKNGEIVHRGINSMQLHFVDDRWWIISWIWDRENQSNRIPASFDSY